MYKVSELLSKKVISLTEAQEFGVAANIIFDKRLLYAKYLYILDDERPDKYLSFKKIVSFMDEAVMIRCGADLTDAMLETEFSLNPINSEAFNQDGKSFGIINDLLIENSKIVFFIAGNVSLPREMLLSRDKKILIFNDSGKPIRISKPKSPKKKTANLPALSYPAIPPEVKASNPCWFLLNKTVDCDIYKNGSLLISKGTVVSQQTIQTASENGRLIQLALHSVKIPNRQ